MVHTIDKAPCQTFARLITRLSQEIRQLTREIPLREGQMQELEAQAPQNTDALRRVSEEIRAARERLKAAEVDLVAMEAVFRQSCGNGGA